MKNYKIFILLTVLSLVSSGCSKTNDIESTPGTATVQNEIPASVSQADGEAKVVLQSSSPLNLLQAQIPANQAGSTTPPSMQDIKIVVIPAP